MAVPPKYYVAVVGHYTITWTSEDVDGESRIKLWTAPMPKDRDEAMQLCAKILVERDLILEQRNGVIRQLIQENVILREEKDQLLKEKDELQMKLMAFQEVLEDLKQ